MFGWRRGRAAVGASGSQIECLSVGLCEGVEEELPEPSSQQRAEVEKATDGQWAGLRAPRRQ